MTVELPERGRDVDRPQRSGDPDQLMAELRESALERVPFEATTSGQAKEHRAIAFVEQQVSCIRAARVGWLVSMASGGAAISSAAVAVRAELPRGTFGAGSTTTDRIVPAGLRVGQLQGVQAVAPVQLCVWRAEGAAES